MVKMVDKYRHELKFICSEAELMLIESRIRTIMKVDEHTDENGEYLIRSVYFDDIYKNCFYDNENGVDPREKYRIRVYNRSSERIMLEKKSKKRGMTGKEACQIDMKLCEGLLQGHRMTLGQKHTLLDEFIREYNERLFEPVMLGEYLRKPYVYPLGNVRVTFDRNISASSYVTGLFDEWIPKVNVLPTGRHVLEVKYDDYLPDVLANIINTNHMQQTTFSKFYLGCGAIEGRI